MARFKAVLIEITPTSTSENIQKKLFELGYSWKAFDNLLVNNYGEMPYLKTCEDGSIWFCSGNPKNHVGCTKMKLEELMTNEQRLAEIKATIALARQQANELEEAMKKEGCVDSLWKSTSIEINPCPSNFASKNLFAAPDKHLAVKDAIEVLYELRYCNGTEEPSGDMQWVIQSDLEIGNWYGLNNKHSRVCPCFKTKEYAQAAINQIGKERIIQMFNTLHSKG